MNKAPKLLEREAPVAATESQVGPQNDTTREASSPSRSAAPEFTPPPPNLPATLVASHRIGRDGAPIAAAPSGPASPDSAPPPAAAPKTEAPSAASQTTGPDGATGAAAPSAPASLALWLKRQRQWPPRQFRKRSDRTGRQTRQRRPLPLAPSTPRLAEAPKTGVPSAASQAIRPDGRPIATAPPSPASTASAPAPGTPKPNATPDGVCVERVC